MTDTAERQCAKELLKLEIWTRTNDRNTVLRSTTMSVGAIEQGLRELEQLGHITRNGNNYTITPAGRTAREALLAK